MGLTLRPVPEAQVVLFPQRQADDREQVVRQFSNHLHNLTALHGSFAGGHRYIEAAVAAAVRHGFDNQCLHDVRKAVEEAFDEELDRLEPPGTGWI